MPTLLYIGQNPTAGTGSPIIVLRHLRRFSAAGWKIIVVADYGGDYRESRAAGWTVHPLCHRRWWWPPYRPNSKSLRWMRLRLLAREVATSSPVPDVVLGYLAAHSDFTAHLAVHVARTTGAPLHLLVHDDAAAFPSARGSEAVIRREHDGILHGADVCWFVSPELADCFTVTPPRRRLLYPIPEGWNEPALWRAEIAERPRVYYAGHVWPEQLPLLSRIATHVGASGGELVVMARQSAGVQALCEQDPVRWQTPFPTNQAALAHLAANAAGVLVSYADTVAAMPWCATSFPSKLVEYAHLGLPIAIVAPIDSAVGRWAKTHQFPAWFAPSDGASLRAWCDGLRNRERWIERAAVSRHLARTLFDPLRIQSELANAILAGTERRAA